VENLGIVVVLHDSKFRKDLISNLHLGVFVDPDEETTFSIGESNDPVRGNVHE
jgi:hypothetical protein